MTDSALLPFLLFLPIFDWTVTGALVAMAVMAKPPIGFLTERAIAAFVIAVVTTAYAGIALNTEQGYPWFGAEVARAAVRVLIVVLGAAPILWLVNFWRGRNDEGEVVTSALADHGGDTPYPGEGDH